MNTRIGIFRLFTSSKYLASIFASALAFIPWIFTVTDKNLNRQSKQDASTQLVWVLGAIWGVGIGATGFEDAMSKKGTGQTADPPNPPNPSVFGPPPVQPFPTVPMSMGPSPTQLPLAQTPQGFPLTGHLGSFNDPAQKAGS